MGKVLSSKGEQQVAFYTSLGRRVVDRVINGVTHEAKVGLNVGLTSTIYIQILKDIELIQTGAIRGSHWHFFRGATQALLEFLSKNGIKYTLH